MCEACRSSVEACGQAEPPWRQAGCAGITSLTELVLRVRGGSLALLVTPVRCPLAKLCLPRFLCLAGPCPGRGGLVLVGSVPLSGARAMALCRCCAFVVFVLQASYRQFFVVFWGLVSSACTSGFACLSESSVSGKQHRSLLSNLE